MQTTDLAANDLELLFGDAESTNAHTKRGFCTYMRVNLHMPVDASGHSCPCKTIQQKLLEADLEAPVRTGGWLVSVGRGRR